MSYRYPYGNTEQMNLDWFLNQWEKFKADWAEAEAGIDGSLDAEIAKVEAAMSELYAARDAAAASASAARQSSLDAVAAQVAAGNSKTAAQAAETSARGSQQAAAQSAQEAQASAQGAENSALTASQAANTATQQAAGADAARGAAEAAQQAAEDAQAAAAQSAGQAWQAATAAADHADDAADSATLAQQAAQDMSDSVEQITTNKNDISDLKESITQTSTLWGELFNKDYTVNYRGRVGSVKGNKITARIAENVSEWIAYPIHGITFNAPFLYSNDTFLSQLTDDDFINIPDGMKDFSIVFKMDNAYSRTVTNKGVTIALYTRQNSEDIAVLTGSAYPVHENNGEFVVCQNVLSTYPILRETKKIYILPISNKGTVNTDQSFTILLKSSETPTIKGIIANFSETTFKASRRYTINQIIQIGFALYRVTTESIASGSDLIVGTNIEKTTITALLTQLLNN